MGVDKRIDQLKTSTKPISNSDLFAMYNSDGTIQRSISDIISYLGPDTNTFTTGSTLNGNVLSFDRNDGPNKYSVDLTPLLSGDSYFTSGSTGDGSIVSKPNKSTGGDATGDYSFSIGNKTTASGVGSRSGGFGTSASGNNSVHEGVGYIVNTGSSITISDLQYFEFARIDLNTMSNNDVEGQPLTPPVTVNGDTHIIIVGDVSFTGTSKFDLLEQFFMDDSQNSMAVNMRSKNPYDFSEIEITSSFDGINTTLVFSPKLEDVYYNIQYPNYLLDIGYGAIGNASTVLGSLNVSDSDNSFTFGNNCLNQSNNGFVGGEYARNSTGFVGDNYNVDYSFTFGRSVQNNSRASVIIGEASSISKNGGNNTLLGYDNNIGNRSGDNYNNTIIGNSSSIFGSSSRNILIGHQNIIFETYDYNYILGSQNKIINGSKNVVLGVDNDVDGGSINSFVLSQKSVITANNSIILGGYSINATSDNTAYVPNLNIDTTPQNDNVLTQILVRDNSTGDIKYKDVSSFTDLNVTGGTYDINTGVVTFTNNEGGTFDVSGFTSGMTDSYTTDATLNGNVIEFGNNIQGSNYYDVDLTPILSGLSVTVSNGLTKTVNDVKLGGTLTENTDIDGDGNNFSLDANNLTLQGSVVRVVSSEVDKYNNIENNTDYTVIEGYYNDNGTINNMFFGVSAPDGFDYSREGGSSNQSFKMQPDGLITLSSTNGEFLSSMNGTNGSYRFTTLKSEFDLNNNKVELDISSSSDGSITKLSLVPSDGVSKSEALLSSTDVKLSSGVSTSLGDGDIIFEDFKLDITKRGAKYLTDYTTVWDNTTEDERIPTKGYVDREIAANSGSGNVSTGTFKYVINGGISDVNDIFNDGNIKLDFEVGSGTLGMMTVTVLTLPGGSGTEVEYVSTLFNATNSSGISFKSGVISQTNFATDMVTQPDGLSANQKLDFILSSGTLGTSYPTYKITVHRTGSGSTPVVVIVDVIGN